MTDLRPIDYNGFTPDDDFYPDDAAECENPAECPECQRDPAAVLLEVLQETQERAYQLAEALGVSRDELNERSGVKAA